MDYLPDGLYREQLNIKQRNNTIRNKNLWVKKKFKPRSFHETLEKDKKGTGYKYPKKK